MTKLEKLRDEFIENWISNNVSNGCSIKLYEDTKEIMKLSWDARDKIAQEREAMLVDALNFYADYMNYSVDYDTSQNGFSRRCVLYKDIEERNEATGLAGLRARQALADYKRMMEGEDE